MIHHVCYDNGITSSRCPACIARRKMSRQARSEMHHRKRTERLRRHFTAVIRIMGASVPSLPDRPPSVDRRPSREIALKSRKQRRAEAKAEHRDFDPVHGYVGHHGSNRRCPTIDIHEVRRLRPDLVHVRGRQP